MTDDPLNTDIDVLEQTVERLFADNLLLRRRLRRFAQRTTRIRRYAFYDELTGLPNRRLLRDRCRHALREAVRKQRGLTLLLVDLEGFNEIDERVGHADGDRLLRQVAERITDCTRVGDAVFRYGGARFAVLLPEFDASDTAESIRTDIRAQLILPFIAGRHTVDIAASIGTAEFPVQGQTYEALFDQAELAMYGPSVPVGSPSDPARRSLRERGF